jgi:hypothetical protein
MEKNVSHVELNRVLLPSEADALATRPMRSPIDKTDLKRNCLFCDLCHYYYYERRAKGRPRVCWIDKIKETLQEHQTTIIEAARKAKTRSLYHPRHPKGYKRK